MNKATVGVLIPVYGQLDHLRRCLESLSAKRSMARFEITLVDDGTKGGIGDVTKGLPVHRVVTRKVNGGFTAAVNEGLALVMKEHDHVVLLNSDMEVDDDWLDSLLERSSSPGVGLVGGMEVALSDSDIILCGGNRRAVRSGRVIDTELLDRTGRLSRGDWGRPERMEWVSFGFALIRRACYEALGPLDSRFRNYFSDTDYGMRATLAGFEVWYEPKARVRHARHASTALDAPENLLRLQRDREKFCRKWEAEPRLDKSRRGRWLTWMHETQTWRPRLIPHLETPDGEMRAVEEALVGADGLQKALDIAVGRELAAVDPARRARMWQTLYQHGLAYAELEERFNRCDREGPPFLASVDVYVCSPHPDDAALSLAGLLLDRGREAVTVVHCLFGESDHAIEPLRGWPLDLISAVRKLEETYWCSQLGAVSRIDRQPDRLVRRPSNGIRIRDLEEMEWSVVEQVVESLLTNLRDFATPPAVFVPLAAGLMADHVAVATAVVGLVRKGYPLNRILVYEDFPYAMDPDALRQGLDLYYHLGLRLEPLVLECSRHMTQALELLTIHRSQIRERQFSDLDDYHRRLAAAFIDRAEPWQRAIRLWKPQRTGN